MIRASACYSSGTPFKEGLTTPIGPIAQEERINSLDALRGFALLGILPANILVFGMYFAAGNDPTVAGGATGLNLAAWALFRILIEGKMRCLFSMVFGASTNPGFGVDGATQMSVQVGAFGHFP